MKKYIGGIILIFLLSGCKHKRVTLSSGEVVVCKMGFGGHDCGEYLYDCDNAKKYSCQSNITIEDLK